MSDTTTAAITRDVALVTLAATDTPTDRTCAARIGIPRILVGDILKIYRQEGLLDWPKLGRVVKMVGDGNQAALER